jgi:hypothetical protein
MNSVQLKQLFLAAAVACAATGTFAQDAMKPAPAAKKEMTMQDCKDRMTTAKGEKRNDTPPNAETDKACADMMKQHGDGKMMKKDTMPKKESGMTQEKPMK